MLKQMREGAKSTVLKLILFGLLLLAMAGLALMDVQGMFRRGVSSNTIAKIGREKLTAPEFDRLVQSALRNQKMKRTEAYRAGLPQQVLKQEIEQRLFSKAAADLGLRISDALAAHKLKDILAPVVSKGMPEKEALENLLRAYSLSEDQLVASLKNQMATQYILSAVSSGTHAPQQLVNDALKYRYEWRQGEYFTLTSEDAGTVKPPAEEELKAYYDSIAGEYALPEYRAFSILLLDKKMIGETVKISDDKIKEYYDEHIEDYKTAETRMISQATAPDETAAKEIFSAAEKTGDLQKAAAEAKGSYVKSMAFTKSGLPAELAEAAFAGAEGKVLPPVRSALGWHILHIEKVTPSSVKSFDSVKGDIEKEISQDSASEALYQATNKIEDDIAGGKTLAEVAKENHFQAVTWSKIDARGMDINGKKAATGVPAPEKVLEAGFGLKKGAASRMIEMPEGAFVIVSADDVFPSETQPFSKVREQIAARWNANAKIKTLSERSTKIMERLKMGESFGKIAGEMNKNIQTTVMMKRGAPEAETKTPANLTAALFSLDSVGQVTTVTADGALTVVRLSDRKIRLPKEVNKKDSDEITAILDRSLRQDLLEQYRMSLIEKYDVSINDKLLRDMYAQKSEEGSGDEE